MVSHAMARALDPNFNADESAYAWKITYDHLGHKKVAIYGPHNMTETQQAKLDAASKRGTGANTEDVRKFRIYDDDGELYFTGILVGDWEEWGFGPLDDYGAPDSGATEIRYLTDDGEKWESL